MPKIIDKINTWLFFDKELIGGIIILSILMIIYIQINSKRQIVDPKEYTEIVKPVNIEFDKFYSSGIYNTNQKLDKIIFDVGYQYQNKVYQNKTILYWEYITPKLEIILEEEKFEKLIVKCNKNNPEKIRIFLDE